MKTLRTVGDLRAELAPYRAGAGTIALVPTMGALHDGHLELARWARADNDAVVMSVFVNPAQFNDPADLAAYPRDERADAELAAGVGVDMLFAPAVGEVYPPGFSATVQLDGPIVQTLEGAHRGVGHFRGVTTVVSKLLGMAAPDRAYFGAKDAQQARVVRALVADLNIDTEIVTVPTVREPEGLAMSSRNRRLSPAEHAQALGLYAALRSAQQMSSGGERRSEPLLTEARRVLGDHDITPEYLALVDSETFLPAASVGTGPALLLLAAQIGATRLIDNVLLGPPPSIR
jgi:pantoate--beta-alanine ligase